MRGICVIELVFDEVSYKNRDREIYNSSGQQKYGAQRIEANCEPAEPIERPERGFVTLACHKHGRRSKNHE